MVQGIPQPLVRANQIFIIAVALLAFVLQAPTVVAIGFVVMILPLAFGSRAHLVFLMVRPLLRQRPMQAEQEDVHVQRFNQTLATVFFGLSVGLLYLGKGALWGWIPVALVAMVAFMATRGFCVGCTIYFLLLQRGWLRRPSDSYR